jgi:antitoxin (DNA-binding transcriptional repressor) of toxin-antitoxin stability system
VSNAPQGCCLAPGYRGIAYACALSRLVEEARGGETICITRRGKPVAQIVAVGAPRKPIDAGVLRALTDRMPRQREGAGDFIHRMRDADRY